jgi:PhnB protein
MSKRPAKPAHMAWLSPYLTVKDADTALDFYQRAFGFEKKFAMAGPDGKTKHAEMTYRDAVFMFGPEGTHEGKECKAPITLGSRSPVGLYVYCEDVAAGAKSDRQPTTEFYGDRVCGLIDPDGHVWYFATNVADFDPSKAPC